MATLQIRNATVYGEDQIFGNGFIEIEDGKIKAVGDQMDALDHSEIMNLGEGYTCIPGFIDVHIHGADGADVMDATPEALGTIAAALPAEGTTSFLATTMTQEKSAIEQALKNAGEYIQKQTGEQKAEVLGIHLEGPFISAEKAGAQPNKYILEPNISLFEKWQQAAGHHIKLVTMAPEEESGLAFVRYLVETGVVASVGHTNATYDEVVSAVEAGASHVTHLYNGMRGMHHREPGVAGAALLRDELLTEVIVDGIHSRPEMIEMAYRQKGKNGLVLITDAMRAKCLKNGTYDLGGQDVTVQDGQARLADGSLAGSILKMNAAARNVMAFTGCSLADVIQIGSVNPAKELNVYDHKGSITPGKDADFVILDDDFNVVMTFCRGELVYKKEGVRL